MKVYGNPLLVNIIGVLVALIKKYKKMWEREDITDQELDFDPNCGCPFFRYCWY
jgi:hypothetical protein